MLLLCGGVGEVFDYGEQAVYLFLSLGHEFALFCNFVEGFFYAVGWLYVVVIACHLGVMVTVGFLSDGALYHISFIQYQPSLTNTGEYR